MHDFGYVALNMKYVNPEDSGTYTCRAVNDLGEAVTSATLFVQCESQKIQFKVQNHFENEASISNNLASREPAFETRRSNVAYVDHFLFFFLYFCVQRFFRFFFFLVLDLFSFF